MDLLRDESGYVLVLRRPRFMLVSEAPEKEQETRQIAKPMEMSQTARCSVPHCCFYCRWCGQPILLPNDRIGSPFGNPDARKIDVRSVATVCLTCKHIGNYSMFRSCRGFDTRHKIAHAQISGETVLLNWLRCVESTCTARVPLFVKNEGDRPVGESETVTWLWDELTCALGHRIRPIPVDPTLQLPLRSGCGSR